MIYENEIVSNTHPNNQMLKSHILICNEMLLTRTTLKGFPSFVYEESRDLIQFCLDKLNSVSGTVSYAH